MAGTYTNLLYHLVFSTKNRQPSINPNDEDDLYAYIGGIVRGIDGTCLEINGMPDHIHLLIKLPPKIAVSDALRTIKANSSKWYNETKKPNVKFSWQDGYAAFSVSRSQIGDVRAYIRNQKKHHGTKQFESELMMMLERNEIDFDEKYLWD